MVDRVNTGVPGLDDLIEGGFPENSTVLLTGGPGVGKTLMSCQFLWEGLQDGEKCLFITTEEDIDGILRDAEDFGWNFDEFEDNFSMEYLNPFQVSGGDFADYMKLNNKIMQIINDADPDRIVIDSISVLSMSIGDEAMVRKHLYELLNILKKHDTTTLLTSENNDLDSGRYSRYGVAEFVTDGVISLKRLDVGMKTFGNLELVKMRTTEVQKGEYEINIDSEGLKIGDETLDIK